VARKKVSPEIKRLKKIYKARRKRDLKTIKTYLKVRKYKTNERD
jgi:hypothetical protein